MTFLFSGELFPGINRRTHCEPPALEVKRSRYWGLIGEIEIRSKPAGRPIVLDITLRSTNGWATRAILEEQLDKLDRLVGTHGELEIFDLDQQSRRTWANCTFEGFVPGEADGDGPAPDVAGTMGGGWYIAGRCVWYDLGPVGDTARG